ncbi:MAG: hypothetical protein J6K89_06225 [Oscillospiraceae bacterium]|nr:hypothetical protein [Oscillospiraceae bacterium]
MVSKGKKLTAKLLCLVLVVITLVSCIAPAGAISPASTKSAKASLAYTLKGLPLGRAVQNFYMGSTYIYITQRVDATTYVSRLKMDKANKVANYVDRMTFTNCGHGQSLDMYTYNGVNYLYMGCKSDTDSGYNWSLQIARIKYEAGKTYNYTNLRRFTYMNYANGTAYRMGDTYRVAAAVCGNTTVFRIQTKNSSKVVYSAYNTTALNKLLDKNKTVDMRTSGAKKAHLWTNTQSGSSIIRPNGSFQGMDLFSKARIYLSGGAHGDTPQIAKINSSGSYKKLVKISNVGKLEIEGIQCKDSKIYFLIVPGTTTALKKNSHKIYYLNESVFG